MQTNQPALNFAGRLLIAGLYLPAGISKVTGFAGTAGYFGSLGIPFPTTALVGTIVLEIVGAIAILVGFQTRLAALALAIFTVAATFLGHAFWAFPADQAFVQQLMFMKNVAVVGGLLVLAAAGPGKWSVDERQG